MGDYRKPQLDLDKDQLDNFSNMFRKATSQPSLDDEKKKKAREEALKLMYKGKKEEVK